MSFNTAAATVMQMSDGWELPPSRVRTLDSLPSFIGGGGGGHNRSSSPSSSSATSSSHSSLQHIPAYNYFDSQHPHHRLYLQQKSGSGSGSGNSSGQKNHKKSSGSGGDVRKYRHKMLERAAYTNRSFMHHNEYEPQRSGFVFESSHYGLDYGDERPRKADRRRHSMHHIAKESKTTKPSKMDDLKHRFDEYSSSAAVERGGSRRPSRQHGSQFIVGGAITGGGARLGQAGGAGSRSLEVYDSQWVPVTIAAEGTRRPKERGVATNNNGGQGATKTPKRGSRSSQGSTDSSHSSHSASSGSLLLTVANLENFAKVHKKHESSYGTSRAMEEYLSSTVGVVPTAAILDAVGSKYNSNIVLKSANPEHPAGTSSATAAIISIEEITSDSQSQQQQQQDPMTLGRTTAGPTKATKDPDSVSMASSTHFTMINGVGGPQRLPKGGLCSRGRQITVLIVTMSIVFMIGICAAVFFLEMRAREMPR